MDESLLDLLRCPYCGTRLAIVENDALVRIDGRIESAVLGCECCAFPVMAGIPVLIADDATRDAMHALEAGRREEALFALLGLEGGRADAFRALFARGERATFRQALNILSRDAEGTCFLYRFSDPTYVMTDALLRAVGQHAPFAAGRRLDLCGGSGHVTRVLTGLDGGRGTVAADLFFWKLWLATRFVAPGCVAVCCDANHPLPFARETFSMVVLADAFPYIWHKRLLAAEMVRLTTPDGVVVMPHLHSALGENFTAGDTLTPAGYRGLFEPLQPRLFSDARLLDDALERDVVDLAADLSAEELGAQPSFSLVATRERPAGHPVFRPREIAPVTEQREALTVNPLYRVERHGGQSVLTLTFPTPEYEEEFAECRRYLPDALTIDADLAGAIRPAMFGAEYETLRRRRIILDAPLRYC